MNSILIKKIYNICKYLAFYVATAYLEYYVISIEIWNLNQKFCLIIKWKLYIVFGAISELFQIKIMC